MKDITGHVFGKLKAISPHTKTSHGTKWACKCECGKVVLVRIDKLTTGHSKSCGCSKIELGNLLIEQANDRICEI